MQMEKIEEFLKDMRMEGKSEGTLREYKRRLERVQKLGIDLENETKSEFLSHLFRYKPCKTVQTFYNSLYFVYDPCIFLMVI